MTIHDATNAIFQFFRYQGDVFDLDDHFHDVVAVSVDETLEREILTAALTRFEKHEIAVRLSHKPAVWVLIKSLDQYFQSVELSGGTMTALAAMVTRASDYYGASIVVDPTMINDSHVQLVLRLMQDLLERNSRF